MKKKKNETTTQFSNVFNFLKELWKDPKGRALLFFGFYFFFFLFLGIAFRVGSNTPQKKLTIPTDSVQKESYTVENIVKGNYQFVYQEDINGVQKTLEGRSYNQMKELTDQNNQLYFLYSGIALARENAVWKTCANPFYYHEIMEEDMLKKVLDAATFESKTVYQNDEAIYRYQISTTTLVKMYQNQDIDISDQPNVIAVYVGSTGEITKVAYNYSSYDTYLQKMPMQTYFTVDYKNYGKIEKLEVPQ